MGNESSRAILPIPDRPYAGVTTYDAKNPDTSFPPIEPLRAPDGAPNVLVILIDDAGFGSNSAFGGPCADADVRAARRRRPEVHALPHHGAVLADACRAAERPESPHGGDGRHHGDRHLGTRIQLRASEHVRPAGRDAQAQRLLHGAVRQVPRGAGLADQPDGSVHRVAERGRRVRALLRLHRRGDEPVRAGAVRRHDTDRARPDAGRGLPPDRGPHRQDHRLGPPAEVTDAGPAVLRVLRARSDPRAASRGAGVVRKIQGPVRPGLGQGARRDVRPPAGARGHSARRGAHPAAGRDPRVGRHARLAEARAGAPDGGVRRLHGAYRSPHRPADRRHRRPGDPRRHAGDPDQRRQRCVAEGTINGSFNELLMFNGAAALETRGVHGGAHRQVRDGRGVQPLRRRLGPRHGHALPVDQAGRQPLGRDAQRHDRPMAERLQGQGRGPQPVPPRDRCGPDRARGCRAAGADVRQRRPAGAVRGREHGYSFDEAAAADRHRPSTSRCS